MSLHKLTAGDGYTYLTRQVAAMDATERGSASLADYYSEKGESPGVWMGSGLAGLTADGGGVGPRAHVSEQQMRALFGEGRHPDAELLEQQMVAAESPFEAATSGRLGKPYLVFTGSTPYRRAVAEQFVAFNVDRGAKGDAPIADEVRAGIRTRVGRELFVVEHGRPPADDRELTGFIARGSRQATTAVAGYDLTFSPVKSASALWATAPREIADQVEAAHHAAVADAVAWLETHAAFTRLGAGGVRQVDTTGLIGAAFTHRDSRAGDPDLHTHVAISNKVQTVSTDGTRGRWLALDGRVLHKAAVAASERYNTRLEVQLVSRLGVRFADRETGETGKRAVREIVGVDDALNAAWSSRRAGIEVRRAELVTGFQARHGRAPSAVETLALSQQATLETRAAKHEPRSQAEQREQWRAEAVAVLGGERALAQMVGEAVTGSRTETSVRVTPEWVRDTAATVLLTVSRSRATWQRDHVQAEAERQVRTAGVSLAEVDGAVDAVVTAALRTGSSVRLDIAAGVGVREPLVLCRADGQSVYSVARTQLFSSQVVIDAEARLLAAAHRTDGRVATQAAVDLALLESTANGLELNPGQVALVRELATSGARLQVALAPAGTGKTAALGVLARAWAEDRGAVLGLAPTAAAAGVLRADLAAPTDTLDKLVHALGQLSDPAGAARVPAWVTDIGPHTLVVVDEAGMAGTPALDTAVDFVLGRGGSVRLVGDDHQLASVSAGGVVRDIAETVGAVTLSHVLRFANPVEGAASLALRTGDTTGIAFYLDNDRIHVGDSATVVDGAYRAWALDRDAGLDAVMLAPTRDVAAALNLRARIDRLAADRAPVGREAVLRNGAAASAGDLVTTRRNDRRLMLTSTDWVRNGDRWNVEQVGVDGSLTVHHLSSGRRITLPSDYVAENVDLGYARTVHSAQGLTADSAHTVATGAESRQLLYVAMTRGRTRNHLYLQTVGDGDPHTQITPEAVLPPTAVDVLTRMVGYDGSQHSATTTARAIADPTRVLAQAAAAYSDALGVAAETTLGAAALEHIDTAAEHVLTGLTLSPAYPALRAHLAVLMLDGADPTEVLNVSSGVHELGTARDPAAVLSWRLDPDGRHSAGPGPLPWLPATPAALQADPAWATYLDARLRLVETTATDVVAAATAWTPTTAPLWARPLVGEDPDLLAELAVWRAAVGVEPGDARLTGPPVLLVTEQRCQRTLDERVQAALGDGRGADARWAQLAERVETRLAADPFWPTLTGCLSAAERAGIDIETLAAAAATSAPLPDEMPAAALWWRLSPQLTPAVAEAAEGAVLRPEWTATLAATLGAVLAERVLTDPAWPALVAAVDGATHTGWTASGVLSTAHELLQSGTGSDAPALRPAELTTALLWRVEALRHAPEADLAMPVETTVSVGETEDPPPEDGDADLQIEGFTLHHSGDDLADWDGVLHHDLPYADLPTHEQVAAISKDLDFSRDALRAARQELLTDRSPHLLAALPTIIEMRHRADTLRPLAALDAAAHELWTNAADELGRAENALAHLRGQSTSESPSEDHRLLEVAAAHEVTCLRSETEAHQLSSDTAHQALVAAAGPTGVTTSADVDRARLTADGLDTDALAAQAAVVRTLEGKLVRAQNHATRERTAAAESSGNRLRPKAAVGPADALRSSLTTVSDDGLDQEAAVDDMQARFDAVEQRLAHAREQRGARSGGETEKATGSDPLLASVGAQQEFHRAQERRATAGSRPGLL